MFESISSHLPIVLAEAEKAAGPFWKSGAGVSLLLVVAVALGVMLARLLTSSNQFSDFRKRATIVSVVILVAGLMIWSKWPPKFGVDLRGGINMIGSLNLDKWGASDEKTDAGEKPTAAAIIPALIKRVNPAGVKEIMIRPLGPDKIEVTIPSADLAEANSIWERLTKAGKLELRIIADAAVAEHRLAIDLARKLATEGSRGTEVGELNSEGKKKVLAYWVTLAREVAPTDSTDKTAPIKFIPEPGHLIRDRASGKIVEHAEFSGSLGTDEDLRGRNFAKWCEQKNIRAPQILVLQPPDEKQDVGGTHFATISPSTDERGRACVSFTTRDEGMQRMYRFTQRNVGRLMATILDDQVQSAATIQEAIRQSGQITGRFTQAEVDEMVVNLKSGKLPVALNKFPISQNFLNSTLGEELKVKGIWAIVASLILVVIFMLIYYRVLGVVACGALLVNGLLVLALMMAIDAPITLTGLAGLVLTIGMAVDANVLIFERMREEVEKGAATRMAIRNGFDKAMVTIIDANVTTLVTALALYVIGTEQLKGFAVSLTLGILCSMFTAIYMGRLILEFSERKRWFQSFSMMKLVDKNNFDWVSKFAPTLMLSLVVIGIGIAGVFMLGKKILDQDLRGGSTARVVFNQPQEIENLRKKLNEKSIEIEGETISFNVSGFNSENAELKNREFKIDSNLRAWDGVGEKGKELTEIIDEVFQGELRKNDLRIEGAPAPAPSNSRNLKRSNPSLMIPTTLGLMTSMVASNSTGIQDDIALPEKQEEKKEETAAQEVKPEAPQSLTGETENKTEPNQSPAADPNTPTVQTPVESPIVPQSGGDFQPKPREELTVSFVDVNRKLKFNEKIAGKSVVELIVRASQEAQLNLDEEQIELDSDEIKTAEQSVLGTQATDWRVKFRVANEADADKILSTFQEKFSQKTYFPTTSSVGGQVASDAQLWAWGAIVASLIGIILYIWFRFQNVAFGLAAVVALIHDVLVVLGAIAVSHWLAGMLPPVLGIVPFKISLEIIAAILTVMGYSLNDTIVIFDRIREVRGKRSEITKEMINQSISQTISRTIITSFTTFMVVFILYCFGGDAIHGFAFALCVGIVAGTYSTIFIACPVLLWLMNTVGLNPGEAEPERSAA